MADSRSYPEDFVPGPSSADALNQLPRGRIAGRVRESNESNIDGVAVVITFTFVVPQDGRRIELRGGLMLRSETTGGVQGRLDLNGTQMQRRNETSLGGGKDVSMEFCIDVEPTADTYTVDLVAGRSGVGTNLVSAVADGGSFGTNYLYVTDVGPAFGL